MLINLTNAAEAYEGRALLLNTDHILSIFEVESEGAIYTSVYSVTRESWQVKETVDEITKLIKQ